MSVDFNVCNHCGQQNLEEYFTYVYAPTIDIFTEKTGYSKVPLCDDCYEEYKKTRRKAGKKVFPETINGEYPDDVDPEDEDFEDEILPELEELGITYEEWKKVVDENW